MKFEIVSISSRSDGTSSRSTCEKMRAISMATRRRRRSACTKSTADRNRAWRNRLGQASGTCTFSVLRPPLSVSSSNDAAASPKRMGISEPYGQSGRLTSVGTMPSFLTVSSAARSTSVAGLSFIHAGK